jgi:DNA polymerase III delta prime subunit
MFTLVKENLHHAYLVPESTSFLPSLLEHLKSLGFDSSGNSDFLIKETETFTIDDAREIKSFQSEMPVGGGKKIIVISTEYFSHQSQHALLKVLEEPASETHFFLLTPIITSLLPTLRSRLITLSKTAGVKNEDLERRAELFLKAEKEDRLVMVAKILKEFDKEETSTKLKVYTVSFLDTLETAVSKREDKAKFDLETLWKVKDYIHDQGSSVKNLLETLALIF